MSATSSSTHGMKRSHAYLTGNLYVSLPYLHLISCYVLMSVYMLDCDDVKRPQPVLLTLRNECCLALPEVLNSLVLSYATPDELDQQLACSVYEGAVNNMHELLVTAARLGRYDFFRSLRDHITVTQIRTDDNIVFRVAAKNGHTKVLVELRVGWGLSAADARANDNYALRMAAQNGHTQVLAELRVGFKLNADDARAMDNCAVGVAALKDHTKVLVELRLGFQLNAADARAMDNYALRMAADNGHTEVLAELRVGWGLTVIDARALDNYALRYASTAVLDEFRLGWGLDVNVH